MAIYVVVVICFPEFMPRCLLRLASGYDCPACGALRALRHIAAGEFRLGFWSNPYLAMLSPYLFLLLIAEVCGSSAARLRRVLTGRTVVIILSVLMVGWWILRNTALWHEIVAGAGAESLC